MVVEELTWYSDPHCHQTTDWIDAAGIRQLAPASRHQLSGMDCRWVGIHAVSELSVLL